MTDVDLSKVIAFDSSRPVPTRQQLERMSREGVTVHVVRRDDGTMLFMGATDSGGNNVDNDCNPL